MCLAIPLKIKSIKGHFAQAQIDGLKRTVNIDMVSGLKIGDYVLVHAGFAIQKIDPDKARETLRLIQEGTF